MIKISGMYAGLLMISLGFVLGCAGSLQAKNRSEMLAGKKWMLVSLQGTNIPEKGKLSAVFTRNDQQGEKNKESNAKDNSYTVTGFSGCNSFRGEAIITENSMKISRIASTRMACKKPENIMQTESEFLKTLESSATYKVSDSSLEIMDASGKNALCFNAGE